MHTIQTERNASYAAEKVIKNAQISSLQSANPHLIAGQGCVTAAKNIRIELKRAFPKLKFSVRSESFAGGNAIRISWTDGATEAQVSEITNKYSGGSFDGMTDCYNYESDTWTESFGSAKYISTSRAVSDELVARVLADLKAQYNTINGEEIPTVAEYQKGDAFYSAWHRLIRQAIVDTAA